MVTQVSGLGSNYKYLVMPVTRRGLAKDVLQAALHTTPTIIGYCLVPVKVHIPHSPVPSTHPSFLAWGKIRLEP